MKSIDSIRLKKNRRRLLGMAGAVCMMLASLPAAADNGWPLKPVKLIVAAPAGSAPDIIARILADNLTPVWKQPIVVDNRPGAGGIIGMRMGSSARADGYTLVLTHASAAVVTPFTYKSAKYDIDRDYTVIATVADTPMGIVANPNAPAQTLAELIQQAKANPNKVALGNPGRTTFAHLAGELINQQAGANIFNVSFGATSAGLQAVVKGDAPYYIDGVGPLLPMVRSKRVKPLVVFADRQLEGLEGIPLAKDAVPGLTVTGWFALVSAAGLPKAITDKINADVNRVLTVPEVGAKFREFGTYPKPGSVSDAKAFIANEKTLWSGVLKKAGIEAE